MLAKGFNHLGVNQNLRPDDGNTRLLNKGERNLNNQDDTIYSMQQIIFSLVRFYLNICLLTLNMEVTRSFETRDHS